MRKQITLLIMFSALIFGVRAEDSIQSPKTLTIKFSPSQALGLRFPVIIEKVYGKHFSSELGVGPTWGKVSAQLEAEYFNSDYIYTSGKKGLGIHVQFVQRWYYQQEKYIGLFYRYGYFDRGGFDRGFLERNQLFLVYGYRKLKKGFFVDYYTGIGATQFRERYSWYGSGYWYENDQIIYDEGTGKRAGFAPTIILGLNIGLNLN